MGIGNKIVYHGLKRCRSASGKRNLQEHYLQLLTDIEKPSQIFLEAKVIHVDKYLKDLSVSSCFLCLCICLTSPCRLQSRLS